MGFDDEKAYGRDNVFESNRNELLVNAATVEGLELTDEGSVQRNTVFVVEHGDVNVWDLL